MKNQQENETLNYFKANAAEWREKEQGLHVQTVNVIEQRNDYVLRVLKKRNITDAALDVGCGTGDLVCRMVKQGISATGIDFADEMIRLAKKKASVFKLDRANFICDSVFDYVMEEEVFDIISANGFIEYVSYDHLRAFFTKSWYGLSKGGSFIIGSRNRLFNLFSQNSFTHDELREGTLERLMQESLMLSMMRTPKELLALSDLPLQEEEKQHGHTGIGVSTRYQFTPSQLVRMLCDRGFEVEEIYPIHIHTVPPKAKEEFMGMHCDFSNQLSRAVKLGAKSSNALLPFSSSFMIHAVKK